VAPADAVENILKTGFKVGTKASRSRIGGGVYFFVRKQRAKRYLKRISTDTGKVYKLLTCSLSTEGKLFYAQEKNFFSTGWAGGSTNLVLGRHWTAMGQPGRFHEMVIKDPKQARILKIDKKRVGRRFMERKAHLPNLPAGTDLWECVYV